MIDNDFIEEMTQFWRQMKNTRAFNDPLDLMRSARGFITKLPAYHAKLAQALTDMQMNGPLQRTEETQADARKLAGIAAGMLWISRRFGNDRNQQQLMSAFLGGAYCAMGRYDRAVYRLRRALPALRQQMPPGHVFLLALECAWVRSEMALGKDVELLPEIDQAISRGRQAGGTNSFLQTLETLRNAIYAHTGEREDAQAMFEGSVEECARRFGRESREYMEAMCQLALTVELPKGNVTRANELLSECLYILETNPNAAWVVPARISVELLAAEIEHTAGHEEEVVPHLRVAEQNARRFLPERDPLVVETTLRLAERLQAVGLPLEAVACLEKLSPDMQEPEWMPPIQRARFISVHTYCQGDFWQPFPYKENYRQTLRNFKEEMRRRGRKWSGEDLQVSNAQEIWNFIGLHLAILLVDTETATHQEIEDAFLYVMEFKGRVAESMCVSREQRFAILYPECRRELEDLAKLRERLRKQASSVEDKNRLMQEKRLAEERLAQLIPELNWQPPSVADLAADLEDLHEDCVLLDFVHIGPPQAGMFSSFAVFILPCGQPESLRMVGLGGADAIAAAVDEFRKTLPAPGHAGSDSTGALEKLWGLVWKPVESALEELRRSRPGHSMKRLFISLDHCLALLPLQALRDSEWSPDDFLIDKYEISYLSTSRDIVNIPDLRAQPGARPLAIGLNKFDAGYTGRPNCGSGMFGPLYYAEDQAREVGRWLDAEIWTGGEHVTRENLLKSLGHVHNKRDESYRSPAVLHIALHGFSLNKSGGATVQQFESRVHTEAIEEALRRSGLALSGAMASLDALHSPEPLPASLPGIVNAYEISGLDLRDTQLVVLATCKSGLGTLSSGEGVFGLQRSFMVAGVHSLIMALWNVSERATAMLVEAFYAGLCRGESRSQALLAAQLQVRKRFKHPADWAGFICQGNPLSISQIVRQEPSREASSVG